MNLTFSNEENLNIAEDLDGLEDVYTIEMDDINQEANVIAKNKISNLLVLYDNSDFVNAHPEFKKRIDTEIESLRRLLKMAKTNEIIHDNLAKAISHNPSNASLYMALTKLQANIMSIQTQINELMEGFNKLCKAYQTEINFEPENQSEEKQQKNVFRGSKAFIAEMLKA
jgi:hypothetical protein